MALYETTIWPHNQPPIFLGYINAKNEKEARKKAANDHNIPFKEVQAELVKDKLKRTSYKNFIDWC